MEIFFHIVVVVVLSSQMEKSAMSLIVLLLLQNWFRTPIWRYMQMWYVHASEPKVEYVGSPVGKYVKLCLS